MYGLPRLVFVVRVLKEFGSNESIHVCDDQSQVSSIVNDAFTCDQSNVRMSLIGSGYVVEGCPTHDANTTVYVNAVWKEQ